MERRLELNRVEKGPENLKKSILIGGAAGILMATMIHTFIDRASGLYFVLGYAIFIFSIGTTFLIWPMIVVKKQVALGTLLIVSKYLTFFLFMSFLVQQSWPASLWLIVGFVVSKIVVLSGYLIFKKRA